MAKGDEKRVGRGMKADSADRTKAVGIAAALAVGAVVVAVALAVWLIAWHPWDPRIPGETWYPAEHGTSYGYTQDGMKYKHGILTVQFNDGVGEDRARQIIGELGCKWGTNNLPYAPGIGIGVFTPEGADEQETAEKFLTYPEVRWCLIDYTLYLFDEEQSAGEDPEKNAAGIDFGEYYLDASGFTAAFDVQKCAGTVTVAVLDTGAPPRSIADLASNVDYDRARNALNDPPDQVDLEDANGHGTEVAGVISAIAGNNAGCTGASWNARILPVKVVRDDGTPDNDAAIRAFDYLLSLDDKPDVVNMSFGGTMTQNTIATYQDRVDRLYDAGVVCVAATGDDRQGNTVGQVNPVDYPAALNHVVCVGALGVPAAYLTGGAYSPVAMDYSNTSSGTDICAHGAAVKVLRSSPLLPWGYVVVEDGGTSLAAPQVAAAAALVKARHPGWGAQDVEDALIQSATKLPAMNGADRTDEYGFGALDADAAVRWARPGSGGGSTTSPNTGGSVKELWLSGGSAS